MLRICPKCSAYYADNTLAFCLVDGTPLVNVDQATEKWTEGTRVIEKQTKSLRKQRRRVKWRRALVTMMTMTMITMVLSVVTLNAWFYLKPDAAPSPSPTPTPSLSSSLSPSSSSSPSSSPSPSPSISPSPNASPTPTPTPLRDTTPTPTPTIIPLYKISGVVTSAGQPLAGVEIKLSGTKTFSTKTDPNGRYVFSDLPAGGSYTLMPALMQVIFAPSSRSFNSLGQDESANFAADVFKISGRVMNKNKPLSGVKVSLEGSKATSASTDDNGYFSFSNLRAGGSYSITPRGQGKFEPSRRSFNNLRRDESGDFNVETELFKISGRVLSPAGPRGGVTISLEGSKLTSTKTDANGYYIFSELRAAGSYTITPRADTRFEPSRRSFDNLRRDESADFVAEQIELYKITGRVTDARGPLAGVSIRLDGTKTDSTTTNAAGNYTFSNLPAGDYTVTPVRETVSFNPSRRPLKNMRRDGSADFSADVPCTEADQDRERAGLLNRYSSTWQRSIESEKSRIIAAVVARNGPAGIEPSAVEATASLGPINYEVVFHGCTPHLVSARYEWQVRMFLKGRGLIVVPVPKQKTFGKLGGFWLPLN